MTNSTAPHYKDLEIVENQYSHREYNINISIPEFNCTCPRTGLPDFANIDINYIPHKWIVELKSLKLYIVKYRNIGIFHEHVTNQIMDHFKKACEPYKIQVIGNFHPRGGIKTSISAEWQKNKN